MIADKYRPRLERKLIGKQLEGVEKGCATAMRVPRPTTTASGRRNNSVGTTRKNAYQIRHN
jgi:hypothetical protein